jgi:hypothetical protein
VVAREFFTATHRYQAWVVFYFRKKLKNNIPCCLSEKHRQENLPEHKKAECSTSAVTCEKPEEILIVNFIITY